MTDRPKIACLHIGTHKTGTSTIQLFFSINRPRFNAAGVYAPVAGRHIAANGGLTPGHHAIAWDLIGSEHSAHFEDAIGEIGRVAPPVALLTSEELHLLYDRPDRIRTIVDGFASIGYKTKVLIYLRDQARYAESLYGELSKTEFAGRFEHYLDGIIAAGSFTKHGHVTPIAFEYTRILSGFADVVGRENMVVRPYVPNQDPEYLLRDFLTAIARFRGGLDLQGLTNPLPMENESGSFFELLKNVYSSAVRINPSAGPDRDTLLREDFPSAEERLINSRFRLIQRDDIVRMREHFDSDNLRLMNEFGLSAPLGSESDIPPVGSPIWDDTARQREILSHAIGRWGLG